MRRLRARLFGALGVLLASTAFGQALTTAFTFQGELRSGGALVSGVYDMRFRLYDAATGGTQVGPMLCSDNVTVANGRCTVQLDFGGQFAGQQRFVEVEVRQDTGLDCTNAAGFTILGPRQSLTGTPNALFALSCGAATSAATATNTTQLNGQPASFYQNAGNLSAGTIPDARLSGTYSSTLNLTNSGNVFAGSFTSAQPVNSGSVVYADNTSSTAYAGVYAINRGSTASYGGYFIKYGGVGDAVRGETFGASGDGIGGYFYSQAASGYGVYGGGGLYGGYFAGSTAVYGSGANYGGSFASQNASGYGLYGVANGAGGIGVYGYAPSQSGNGTFGGYFSSVHGLGQGAHCVATATGSLNYGLVGETLSSSGYGVYSLGRFAATGTKAFCIDDPRDPENKFLMHYCTESPEVLNAYSGKVMLDAQGAATVSMPAYFAAINKDPRYTLTAVGAAMPLLHVAEEISEEALTVGEKVEPGRTVPAVSFRIEGGVAGGKVCWRVEALRNDRWMQRHGAAVEQEKPDSQKGTYQDPDLYGQPAERRWGYRAPEKERAEAP